MNPFQFDIRNLPEDGKNISGTQPASFFGVTGTDIKAVSPFEYDLEVVRDGKDIIVTGQVAASFELQCGRCLEPFVYEVAVDDYQAEVPIEKETTTMDLTDMLREDILLALPNFPRCEDGNVEPRQCPAEGKFDPAEPSEAADETSGTDRGVWDALDKLK